jgi:hypothetical protein
MFKCLQDRATAICTNEDTLKKEESTLTATLVRNGYPPKFVKLSTKATDRNPTNQETTTGSVVVAYIWGISEKIPESGKKVGIRTAFRSRATLRSRLTK